MLTLLRKDAQADKFLRSDGYRNYDLDSLREGKAACKAALQRVRSLRAWLKCCCLERQFERYLYSRTKP